MKQKHRTTKLMLHLVLIPIFMVLAGFSYLLSNRTKTLESLSYTERSNIDYQVCLRENNFYAERCQPKGRGYIASAINNIDVVFDYDFATTTNVNYKYEYYIDGIITVFDRNDSNNILFTKTVKLLDTKVENENDAMKFNITERLKIDYHEYNDLIRSFKSEYNVSADSSLKLKLYIKTTIDYKNFKDIIETTDEMELAIPLTENTINISMNYTEINISDEFVQTANKTLLNNVCLIFSIMFACLGGISIILSGLSLYKKVNSKSKYERFIKNKTKNLDRLIVSAKEEEKINENDYKEVIDVRSFNELVDIAERLTDIIMWTEVTYPEETVSWFTVADNKERLYRIIYKSNDEEFK